MREAQKLMNDPAFQEQMKKMTAAPGFQAHMKKTQDMLKDPQKVKEMEKKMENALKEGNKMLDKANAAKGNGDKDANDKGETGDDDEKQTPETEEGEDMPDIPSLNLN